MVWYSNSIICFRSFFIINNNHSAEVNSNTKYKLGDIITLSEKDKELLKSKTEDYIKQHLKTPSIAKFQEQFEYICTEPNIVKVEGYVDSQNSFGAMIRDEFVCEYFTIDGAIDTLVYSKYDDTELLNIKDTYIEGYKKQNKLDNIKSSGNELNQEKLDYIMNEFNNEEFTSAGKITLANFEEKESNIDIQITVKNMKSKEDKQYWIYYNIIHIIDYIKEFDSIGTIKVKLYVDNIQVAYAEFDEEFLINIWKDNKLITEVPKLFGENYKEMF